MTFTDVPGIRIGFPAEEALFSMGRCSRSVAMTRNMELQDCGVWAIERTWKNQRYYILVCMAVEVTLMCSAALKE